VTPESRGRAGRLDLVDRHHQGTHRPARSVEVQRRGRRRPDGGGVVTDEEEAHREDRRQADPFGLVLIADELAQQPEHRHRHVHRLA